MLCRLFLSRVAGAMLALAVVIGSVSTAFADPRDFALNNSTGKTIMQVFVAPSNMDDWGDDILGPNFLDNGQSVTIKFSRFTEGSCYYDIRVVVDGGAQGELNQVNLCETATVTFN